MRLLLLIIITVFSTTLFAEEVDLDNLLDQLSAPTAIERAQARIGLVKYDGLGLNWRVKSRWNDGIFNEQLELLDVMGRRRDSLLLKQALEWLNGDNHIHAIDYLVLLKEEDLLDNDDVRLEKVLVTRGIYEFTKFTLDYMYKYGGIEALHYNVLRKQLRYLDKAAFEILYMNKSCLEGIELGREAFLNTLPDSEVEDYDAVLDEAQGIIQYKTYLNPGHFYKGVDFLRNLQFQAIDALRYSGRTDCVEGLNLILVYYQREYEVPMSVEYSLMNPVFINSLKATLYLLDDKTAYEKRLAGLKRGLDDMIVRMTKSGINVNASIDYLFRLEEYADAYLNVEEFEDASKIYDKVLSVGMNIRVTQGGMVFAFQARNVMRRAYYNRACCNAAALQTTKTINDLQESLEFKYFDWKWFVIDSSFLSLHNVPKFKEWVEKNAPPATYDDWNEYYDATQRSK